jgi:hypothetical protein
MASNRLEKGPVMSIDAEMHMETIDELLGENAKLREALTLPLIFYGGWTEGDQAEWKRITGTREGTTKVMCDHIRNVLTA